MTPGRLCAIERGGDRACRHAVRAGHDEHANDAQTIRMGDGPESP